MGGCGGTGFGCPDGGDSPSGPVRDGAGTGCGTKPEPGQEQMGELVGDGERPMRPTVPALSPLGRAGTAHANGLGTRGASALGSAGVVVVPSSIQWGSCGGVLGFPK